MRSSLFNLSLRNMSIHVKLLIAPLVLVLALVLNTSLAIYGLNTQTEALKRTYQTSLDHIAMIDRFALVSEQVQSDVYRIAVLRFMEMSDEEIEPVQARLDLGTSELKITYGEIATTWSLDKTEQTILENMKPPMDDFMLQAKQAADVVTSTPSFGVIIVRSSSLSFNKFKESLDDLLDYQYRKITQSQLEIETTTGAIKTTLITLLFLVALTGILTNLMISNRFIARPIQTTTQLMERLANNDLTIELHGLERKDEIGDMAQAVEVFRNNAIEKAKLDKELQDSQGRLLMAQEVAHIGNWELDLASHMIWASVEAFRIYGLDRSSPYLTLADVQKIPINEDRPRLDAALNALLENQTPYNEQFHILRPFDESIRVIHSLANLVCDENGVPVSVIGVIQDITERVQAETALKQSEEKFSKAFQTAYYAITITHADDGRFVDVNEAFTTMSGVTREEALSSSSIALNLWVNEEDRQSVLAALRAGQDVSGQEFLFRNKNGEIITCLFSAQLVSLNDKRCVLSSINDITERKRAVEKLEQFSAELERSNTELEQFAYVASHDLQEPLRMVISYLRLIETRFKDDMDDDVHDFINFAVDGAQRMRSMIGALLDISRVSTHGKQFTLINIETVLEQVLQNLQLVIADSDALITHDPLPSLMADDRQMVQLFQNLIGNAIKFHGEEAPKVHIGVRKDNDSWLFSFQDNGIGIDPKFHDRAFIIFQRLQNREEYEGTGIGLAICKRIVERHGGRIWIESEPGKGSTFYFTITNIGERE